MRLRRLFETPEITEGLIPVPQHVLKPCLQRLIGQILWYMRDKFRGNVRNQFPAHYAAFQALAKEYGIKIPKAQFDPSLNANVFPIALDLPAQYQGVPIRRVSFLVLDWLGEAIIGSERSTAAWYPKCNCIIVYFHNNPELREFPSKFYSPSNLALMVDQLKTIEHELPTLCNTCF